MCDTLAIVDSSGVLFAKNSDRDANEAQLLEWHARASHPVRARLKCTWIEIPEAPQTHAVLLSRPWWMWGAEMGTNEYGVTIGNEAVFTRQRVAATGLTGMDLVRLGLERAASAEEAIRVIVALIEEFGQGGLCSLERKGFTYHNSFIVADPRRAFVLETAGREHAVEEIAGARSISNGLTIPGFAEQHSDRIKTRVSACRWRQARTQHLAERSENVADLMRILRDHGEGHVWPRYSLLNGGLGAPCVHAGGMLAASQTAASWVADLRPGAIRHWATATAAPCTSLFKPVAVNRRLDFGPSPEGRANESLWWRHERLHRAVMRDPAHLAPHYLVERDALEAEWLVHPPDSQSAFEQADSRLADWIARVQNADVSDVRPRFVRRLWRRYDAQAGVAPKDVRYAEASRAT